MDLASGSDLILGVMRAASPAEVKSAARRLAERSAASGEGEELRRLALAAARFEHDQPAVFAQSEPARPRATPLLTQAAARVEGANPHRKFEAFVLQMFIEAMLPRSDTAFGTGTAGEVWRSFMAEAVAGEAAKGQGIGIASHLASAGAAQQRIREVT